MANVLKVLFLDIDGVLLPFPNGDDSGNLLFPESTLNALQHLLSEVHGAKVVLSSTWRVRKDFIEDIENAIRGHGIRFEGFFDITDPALHCERQWEIENWLSNQQKHNYQKIVWLALDDEELLEGDVNKKFRERFTGHVVKTKSHEGLTMNDANTAIRLWTIQTSS